MRRLAGRIIALALTVASSMSGYIRLTTCTETTACAGTPIPLQRVDNTAIQFVMDTGVVAGATSSAGSAGKTVTVISANSNPQAAARAALTTWNNVSTAGVTFLPLQVKSAVAAPDGIMSIVIATAAEEVSYVGGALAVTLVTTANSAGQDQFNSSLTVTNGSIIDTDILLNPGVAFSTDGSTSVDLQAVITHELGHSLGADHTGLYGATMFQFNSINQRFLSSDDLAFVNTVYPAASGSQPFGTISGTVTLLGLPVPYALLSFVDTSKGNNLGGVSNPDGTFSVKVPPGNYNVYAEPFNSLVTTNYLYLTYLSAAQLAAIPLFQPTLLSGTVAVTANNTTMENIPVTAGSSAFAVPYVGLGGAGRSGDVSSFSLGGPLQAPSGQSFDVLFSGAGFDSTLTTANFTAYGAGFTTAPSAVRVDSAEGTVAGFPVVRATFTVTAQPTPSLASIFVSKGGNTLSLTGALVIVPPTPSFVAADAVSAASNIVGNGTVSPGEYVTLYGTAISPTTGPYFGIGYTNTGYIMGFLPQNLGGSAVTFDGVPAPIFFTGAGGQINLQVPFEVAGKTSTKVVASFFGSPSAAVTLPVAPLHPALFTYNVPNLTTPTTAYAANADFSTITSANPAARGSTIIVVGTGIGLPTYSGVPLNIQTGAPAPGAPTSTPDVTWTCTIGGVSAPVAYVAYFAGFTAEAEWYVTVPSSLTTTGAVPIQFTSSTGVSTQSNLTVYIK